MFSKFLSDESLNRNQMEFVKLVVNYVAKNGIIDKSVLNEHPFNKHGNVSALFEDRTDIVKGMISFIDGMHRNFYHSGRKKCRNNIKIDAKYFMLKHGRKMIVKHICL